MSLNGYANPLHLDLSPSLLSAVVLIVLHLLAMVCIFLLPFPVFYLLATGLLLVHSLWQTLLNVLLIHKSAITSLVWKNDNDWLVNLRSGELVYANLLSSSYVHPDMTVLNFRLQRQNKMVSGFLSEIVSRYQSKSVVLLTDNIDKDSFRRLRVRLKIQRHCLTI